MTNLVQFPGLGLSFELDRVAFSIGGADIYWYGVCIASASMPNSVQRRNANTSARQRPKAMQTPYQ